MQSLSALIVLVAFASQQPQNREAPGYRDHRLAEPGQIAPLLEGLGEHHHPVTTQSERAQLFFDQGLRLSYAFNHREAARAFREAARLDPDCAMAYWGLALVHGPNLNIPMDEESARTAYESIQMALALKEKAPQAERDYIDAMATRFEESHREDRSELDQAYAKAMKSLTEKYPDDQDAATLYGAALMNLSPWDYWWNDGRPYERTRQFLSVFQSVIERNPKHPGALHYYIHAVEAQHPEWAVEAAQALQGLMPSAGHMVHMPSHIFMRVGRYREAFQVNLDAVAADESYISQCRAQGIYPLAYYPHNIHFLWSAATFMGRSGDAIAAAREAAAKMPHEALHGTPSFQTFSVVPYYAWTRFGKWDEILRAAEPDEDLLFARGIWHYARGNALRARSELERADAELRALQKLASHEALQGLIWLSPPADVLAIAVQSLAGEIEAARGNYDQAILHLSTAVRLQDALPYNEPPDWHYPVRHSLGAVLLEAGRAKEAEVVYWEDLRQFPENGWSLFGLAQALRAQGEEESADAIEQRFKKAWANADAELKSSRF